MRIKKVGKLKGLTIETARDVSDVLSRDGFKTEIYRLKSVKSSGGFAVSVYQTVKGKGIF